jgi:CRAL/TRIO domain
MLNIFQMHYPERLAESLIINVPFLIHAFFKMISPFMDPVTRNKLKFNPNPVKDGIFAADELFKEGGWGGSRDFVWDHEKYWPAFVRMCDEIAVGQMARWRKLGARVGCDEKDYKLEDFVGIVPGSPVTSTAKASAEARAGDGEGDRGVVNGAAPETGGVVEEPAVSQTGDETSAAETDLEPSAI